MPDLEIHYAGEWAALYKEGELAYVGETYVAEEAAFEMLRVRRFRDDAFMRGQKARGGVARNLAEVAAYAQQRDASVKLAAEKIADARRLLMEAKALDPEGRTDHGVSM